MKNIHNIYLYDKILIMSIVLERAFLPKMLQISLIKLGYSTLIFFFLMFYEYLHRWLLSKLVVTIQ